MGWHKKVNSILKIFEFLIFVIFFCHCDSNNNNNVSRYYIRNIFSCCLDYTYDIILMYVYMICQSTNEPPHDKTNQMTVRPAKTQIGLGIRPV